MVVSPNTPHKNGIVSRPNILRLGRLVEETLPVVIERLDEQSGEYIEVELDGYDFRTVRGDVKVKLAALSDAYQKKIRPDPDDIDPEDGQPRFVPNQAAWEHYIASALKLLVPKMGLEEAAFLANWGHNSEQALKVLYYLNYWRTPPAGAAAEGGTPDPEVSAGASA
jgi:hypothetical protein